MAPKVVGGEGKEGEKEGEQQTLMEQHKAKLAKRSKKELREEQRKKEEEEEVSKEVRLKKVLATGLVQL